jgi:hypothetical protein
MDGGEGGSEDGIEKGAKKTVVTRDSAIWNCNEACEANLATSHNSITCKMRGLKCAVSKLEVCNGR